MADFVMPPDEGADQQKAAAPLTGTGFVMPIDPNPVTFVNARDAASGNPDEYAKAKKIAERLGMPVPVVQSDLSSFDTEQKVADVQARMARDPFYAQQMRDPNFAKLSSGDEGVLGAIQQAVSVLGRSAGQLLVGGPTQIGAQLLDVSAAFYDVAAPLAAATTLTDGLALDRQARATRRMAEDARKAATFFFGGREDESPLIGAALSGVQSASAMLMLAPAAAKIAVEKTVAQAATYIAGVMAGGVGAQAFTQAREKGRGVLGATAYAVPHAGFEYIFERTPVGVFLQGMAGKTGFIPFLWNMVKAEVPNEQYTTLFQDFNEWVRLNPERTLRQYLEERPSAAAQTLVATLVGAGVQTGVARGVQKVVDFAHGAEDAAHQDAAALQALLDYANQSALAKRDVPTFTQFVNDAAAQGPVTDVYIDAATFAQAAQQAGVDLKTTMPETAAALDEAVATKSDVRIPLGEFAANSTLFQPEIVQHLKTDPNGATQAQIADAAWVKETQATTEKALAQQEFTDATKQSAEVVKTELKAQLDAANRFTPEVNDAYAGFMSAFYATQAARLGITPEEMYVRYPLHIQSQNFEGANVLTQPAATLQDFAPGAVRDVLQKDNWTILTAENPNAQQLTPGENAARMDELRAMLKAEGVAFTEVKGKYGNEENSLLITGVTPQRALELGKQFGQESVLTRQGLIYQDGTVTPATGVTEHTTLPEDFYSVVPETGAAFSVDLDFDAPRVSFEQSGRVKNVTPAISKLLKNLTPQERQKVTDSLAARIIEQLETLPAADEMAAVAYAGRAKRGWYAESARAISEVFGWDAPHFAALLAALSPQTSVEINLGNTLRTWRAWDAAGRPRDRKTILEILAKNVEGTGTEKSVLNAWINNAVHALQDIDTLTSRPLSGAKVNSFYMNLLGNVNEVTLDAWMANYALVNQFLFQPSGQQKANLKAEIVTTRDPGKSSTYLAYASRVREAAARLTKLTGEAWTPAEVQETVWSWAKALYETANKAGSESTAQQIVLDDALTNDLLTSVPDFATLFSNPKYASILQDAGYGQQLDELAKTRGDNARQPGEDDGASAAGETTPFDRATQKRHEARAAKRLDKLAAAGGKKAIFAQSALKLPEYGQTVPGSISVVGVHFSKEARPVLLSSKMGTGMKGAEQARAPMPRINFYVNQGSGVTPERDVGAVPHAVRLNGLYDASADRLSLFKTGDLNEREQAVVAHGFTGYYSRDFANGQGAAVLLGQHAVQAKVLDSTKAITEVPPPREVTPERALAEALMAVPGLPSGQMSGASWVSTLWKAAPQIASQIPETALATLEAHTDLMYRDEVARTFYQMSPEVAKFLEGSAVQQVVYHGTQSDIEVFDPKLAHDAEGKSLKLGFGKGVIWFSGSGAGASGYAERTGRGKKYIEGAPNVVPVYLSIKNPFVIEYNGENYGRYQAARDGFGEWYARGLDGRDKHNQRMEAFVRDLKKEGYDAIVLPGSNAKDYGHAKMGASTAEYGVFDHNQIMSALSGQMMQGEVAPRGQISFGSDVQATPSVLTLLANADLSTFLHESGHFYLEVLNDMAAQPDAPQGVVDDFAKTLAWFGVKDAAAWNAMSLEAKRPFHEQFARGFEAYLFEGRAPSEQMQSTFQKFRSWLVNVYQQIKALDVALTDEVRGVFDRLVATNDEILQAETARTFAPLYETKPEGMTDTEWADYHVLGGDATQEAVDQLQTRSLRDMQYASNAKAAALKRLQARANVLRKGVRAEVTAEVSAEPIYQVMRFLKTGVYEGENAGTYTTHRLDIATLDAMYPEDMADRPPLLNLAQMRGHDGIAPDVVAQMFGYGSGDALVRELLRTEPMRNKIDGLTDQRMLERYGDIADPASMEKAANAAVHNEVRAKFVATELRTLEKAAGNKQTLAAMAREFAATLIARKKIRTIRPAIYAAAAAKAAKNADTAFRKDDVATAAGEKRNQLVNVYAARFAHEATDEVEKSVAYLKRVGESKAVDPEYRAQIAGLLERFDLRKVSQREAASRQSLLQWMEAQREKGFEPAIDPALENEANRKPYQDMTLEEFRGLVDSIKNIEHLGRLKSKLLKLADQRAFAVIVEDVANNIHNYAKRTLPHETEAQMSARKQILAMHTKLSSFMRQLDGWKDNGIMQRLFIHSSNAAGAQEALAHEAATIKLVALFEPLLMNESLKQKAGRTVTPFGLYRGYMGEKLFIPEINEALSREARIMVALNTGTEGNLQRLMDGDHWSDKQVQAVLDTLTKQEMDFVQSVWDFIGSYRPAVGEQQKRLTGVEPTWISARQVVTKHGVYAGGYLPAKYNGAMSSRSLSDEAAANLTDALRATRGSASARASFTKERAAKVVNRPLRKDLGVITQHITEVTHRLAWQEWLVDVNRILRANPVDQAIREHYGPEMLESIRENIAAIAAGNVGAQNALERGVNYLRTGATIAGLAWRLTTSLLQPIGLTQSMVRIGPKWVGKGLVEFLGDAAHMENSFARIAAKSEMMRLRAKTMQREISEIQDQVTGEGGPIKASFFYLIQKMQLVADIPTWWGQYHKAIASSGLQDPAALEANAIAQADQAVLDAQGSGQVKDLPAVLRGSPYLKLWTNFASFFVGTTFQLTREAVGRTTFTSPASVLMLAVDFVLLYTLPSALGTLMKYALSDDDDEGKLIRTLIAEQLSYMLGTMIGLRELGSVARAVTGLPGDYGGPAGGRILGEVTRLGKQIQQGEADEAFFKALNNAAGVIFHYPAGQINATADGIAALAEGKTANPGVLAVGSSKR